MSGRRFTDKPELNPADVWGLDPKHPAMIENRTLFPSTVVEVTRDKPDRLLVSGHNNRKLGATVEKGRFKGYALYGLSLEERATCPKDCAVRSQCYGSSMQYARRHRIGDPSVFFDRLNSEIEDIIAEHVQSQQQTAVLGDFPSPEYVSFWDKALSDHKYLAVYGYTARKPRNEGGDTTGDAIAAMKKKHVGKFRIRWSRSAPVPDGAYVIDFVPDGLLGNNRVACPAQTDATACCATCGLCWETDKTIAFIKHGRTSGDAAAAAVNNSADMAPERVEALHAKQTVVPMKPLAATLPSALKEAEPPPAPKPAVRPIVPVAMPPNMKPEKLTIDRPDICMVRLAGMRIEESYQRSLSSQSIRMIRRIVMTWNWAKFKVPIVVPTDDGFYNIVDGQHTAIAAATHPNIAALPCLIIKADEVADRAASFVSHNTDRLRMTAFQIFIARVSACEPGAVELAKVIDETKAFVPRYTVKKGEAVVGEITGISSLETLQKGSGAEICRRVLNVAVLAQYKPIDSFIVRALGHIFTSEMYAGVARASDAEIAAALAALEVQFNVAIKAERTALDTKVNKYKTGAMIIAAEVNARAAVPKVA